MRDLDEILADQFLRLPIRGETYVIQPMGWKDELRIKNAQALIEKAMRDEQPLTKNPLPDEEFIALVLGPALTEMREDNLPSFVITHAALTAHAFNEHGLAVAEQMWEHGPSPEALAASMQAAAQTVSTPSPSTASATPTRSPASTRTTTSRKATPRKAPAKAPRSRSRSSSSSSKPA